MKKKKEKEVVYIPNFYLKLGPIKIWNTMFSDLISSYSLGWRLFIRDFSSRYKQQLFGLLWVIVGPLFAVATFTLLAKAKILNIDGIAAPYPVYAFLGVAIWGLLQGIIVLTSGAINSSGGIINKINFPKESLLVSPLYTALLNFVIKMLLFLAVCIYYKYFIKPFNILYIFLLIPGIFFGLGVGMFLTIFGTVMKDVKIILQYIFQFLMIMTPVMYQKPSGVFLGKLAIINPLYYLVVVPRDLILFGESDYVNGFIICSTISLILFFSGWRFYKITVSKIIEKV